MRWQSLTNQFSSIERELVLHILPKHRLNHPESIIFIIKN